MEESERAGISYRKTSKKDQIKHLAVPREWLPQLQMVFDKCEEFKTFTYRKGATCWRNGVKSFERSNHFWL